MADKAFARQVRREDILRGAKEIGLPLDDHINNCLMALQSVSEELEL